MENKILLPRTTKEGKPRVSYSQVSLFNSKKSFNLGIEGELEYIISYFLGHQLTPKFGGESWSSFGKDVELYIGERERGEAFSIEEKEVLDTIEPLGVVSTPFELDLGEFVLTGLIDDRLEDWSKIRDYKTASKATKKQYEKDSYIQLDLYALVALEKTGKIPKMEVCVIERSGNGNKGGRDVLKVAGGVWYIEKTTTLERLRKLKEDIFEAVLGISNLYKTYLKYNK